MQIETLTKRFRHDDYLLEVDVEAEVIDHDWSPLLPPDQVEKLDDARRALRTGDLKRASQIGRLYRLALIDDTAA